MKRSISFHRTMYLTTLQVKYIAGNNLKKDELIKEKGLIFFCINPEHSRSQ